jgi:hypothetical protein
MFPNQGSHFLQVYKSFSDAVVLDWFISLADKDRLSHCEVTYSKQLRNARDVTHSDDVIVISPFLPVSRTFVLKPLAAGQTYSFLMNCRDAAGGRLSTQPIVLKTSETFPH